MLIVASWQEEMSNARSSTRQIEQQLGCMENSHDYIYIWVKSVKIKFNLHIAGERMSDYRITCESRISNPMKLKSIEIVDSSKRDE